MGKHNKTGAHDEAIDRSVKYPEKKNTEGYSKKRNRGWNPPEKVSKNEIPENPSYKPVVPSTLREKYAAMLNVKTKEIDNYELYHFIDEWYGVKYCMGGLDKSGIDCSGFTKRLYEKVYGVDLAHSSGDLYANCQHLKNISSAEEGDLVFFKTRGKRISHVGVYLMNDYFVHASSSQGIVISNLKEEYWQKHYAGAGKMK